MSEPHYPGQYNNQKNTGGQNSWTVWSFNQQQDSQRRKWSENPENQLSTGTQYRSTKGRENILPAVIGGSIGGFVLIITPFLIFYCYTYMKNQPRERAAECEKSTENIYNSHIARQSPGPQQPHMGQGYVSLQPVCTPTTPIAPQASNHPTFTEYGFYHPDEVDHGQQTYVVVPMNFAQGAPGTAGADPSQPILVRASIPMTLPLSDTTRQTQQWEEPPSNPVPRAKSPGHIGSKHHDASLRHAASVSSTVDSNPLVGQGSYQSSKSSNYPASDSRGYSESRHSANYQTDRDVHETTKPRYTARVTTPRSDKPRTISDDRTAEQSKAETVV